MTMTTNKEHLDTSIRFLHLVIMSSFLGAYLTGDSESWHQWHMMFGYTLAIALGLRLIWQFIAPTVRVSQPFGIRKRTIMAKNLLQLFRNKTQEFLFSKTRLQLSIAAIFQLSIVLLFIVLPTTVTLGYFTENTHSHTLKEIHELFANLFLAIVLVHLAALLFNSLLMRQFLAKKMLWSQGNSLMAWIVTLLMLAGFIGFWNWYLS